MGLHLYLVSFAKLASDLFGLPDVYTYILSRRNCFKSYHLIPFSLFIDIVSGFYLGTFFIVDFIAYFVWVFLKKYVFFLQHVLFLYLIRYFLLYLIGLPFLKIINQLFYCFFFIVFFEYFNFKKFLPKEW